MSGEKLDHNVYFLDHPETPFTDVVLATANQVLHYRRKIKFPDPAHPRPIETRVRAIIHSDLFLGLMEQPNAWTQQELLHALYGANIPGLLVYPSEELLHDPNHPNAWNHPLVSKVVFNPRNFEDTFYRLATAAPRVHRQHLASMSFIHSPDSYFTSHSR